MDDKNPAKDDGLTPLALAANNGHLKEIKSICEKVLVKTPRTNDEHCQIIYTNTAEISILGLIWTAIKNLWK